VCKTVLRHSKLPWHAELLTARTEVASIPSLIPKGSRAHAHAFFRRRLFAGALGAFPVARWLNASTPAAVKDSRSEAAFELRKRTANLQSKRGIASMALNGDEDSLPKRIACYAKGLPRNQFGEVEAATDNALLIAIRSQKHTDFERIPRDGRRKVNDPQAAFTSHVEGGDPRTFGRMQQHHDSTIASRSVHIVLGTSSLHLHATRANERERRRLDV
jgi:hypothetical protein